MSITVVLNGFKRQEYLEKQIESVRAQSVPPEKIIIWNNGEPIDWISGSDDVMIANNSDNLGVWSRFAYALNAETEFVCLFDDDTFPSPKFFESCLAHMEQEEALYGARGLRFLSKNRYHPFSAFGWDMPNESAEYVDIVGHAWFFKREWLGAFWRELPPLDSSRLVGEDMHLSHMLQKHLGIPTKVPPHPLDNLEIWGSDPKLAVELGTSKEAVSQSDDALKKFDTALKYCTDNGFKLVSEIGYAEKEGIVIGPGITRFNTLKKCVSTFPLIERLARKLQAFLAKRNIHI